MSARTPTEILALLERHGLHPRRGLGQHFLADANLVQRIVREAGVTPGRRVLEVGAGTGVLTRALAEAGARVLSFEVDERLRPLLAEVLEGLDVEVRFADASRVDLVGETSGEEWWLVSNLPYGVGTPLLLDLVSHADAITRFVVMVQLEVAERIVADPGSRVYGLPSVVAQIHARVRIAFRVSPSVFLPPPRVTSAVVVLDRREAPSGAARACELAAAAFGQRRKMVRRSLARLLPDAPSVLERAGIDPTARAEDLAPDDFLRIAEALDA